MKNANEFAQRRKKLLNQLGTEDAAIMFSASHSIRNGDVHFPFRQDSTFYYYTGFSEPDAVALFLPNRAEGEFILFNRSRNPELEKWEGPCAGQENACQVYGAEQAFDIKQLDEKIIALLTGRLTLFYELGKNRKWDRQIVRWFAKLQAASRKSADRPKALSDLNLLTQEMRLIKSQQEIEALRKAAQISAAAHSKIMQACRPRQFEFELAALFDYDVKINGCSSLAYPSIVGGGRNACILHYVDNKDPLQDGELVLIDAGAEYHNYAADITRTFPVNGKFSPTQAAAYQVVLTAQLAAIEAVKPGIPWNRLQEIAVEHLTRGMVELGILKGSVEDTLEKKAYHTYYMHNIGHWLGLDVHDVGPYKYDGQWRSLQEGMVLTIEPGLYLAPHKNLASKWWNIGIRIEDDVLVTAKGHEVLSAGVPKTIAEIEALMSSSR